MTEHTYKQFDADLEELRSGVLAMGGLVEQQFELAIAALEDAGLQDSEDHVSVNEEQVNRLQVAIDQQCSQIIARRQPTAVDLRLILAVTKVVNDLERIGDEVKKIARKAAGTQGDERLTRVRRFQVARTARSASRMTRTALDAFARLDLEAAAEVIDRDEEIDAEFHAVLRQLVSYMMEDPRTIGPAVEMVFIAKSIERIGDHAKNVAEAVVQGVKGKDVRHASAAEVRAELSGP